MKVFELAHKLQITSKDAVAACRSAGIPVRSHISEITEEEAAFVETAWCDDGCPASTRLESTTLERKHKA